MSDDNGWTPQEIREYDSGGEGDPKRAEATKKIFEQMCEDAIGLNPTWSRLNAQILLYFAQKGIDSTIN